MTMTMKDEKLERAIRWMLEEIHYERARISETVRPSPTFLGRFLIRFNLRHEKDNPCPHTPQVQLLGILKSRGVILEIHDLRNEAQGRSAYSKIMFGFMSWCLNQRAEREPSPEKENQLAELIKSGQVVLSQDEEGNRVENLHIGIDGEDSLGGPDAVPDFVLLVDEIKFQEAYRRAIPAEWYNENVEFKEPLRAEVDKRMEEFRARVALPRNVQWVLREIIRLHPDLPADKKFIFLIDAGKLGTPGPKEQDQALRELARLRAIDYEPMERSNTDDKKTLPMAITIYQPMFEAACREYKVELPASRKQETESSKTAIVPVPPDTAWGNITIEFINTTDVWIAIAGKKRIKRNFQELSFADDRTSDPIRPDKNWVFLRLIAVKRGIIDIPVYDKESKRRLEVAIYELSKKLKECFGLEEKPFDIKQKEHRFNDRSELKEIEMEHSIPTMEKESFYKCALNLSFPKPPTDILKAAESINFD